MLKNLQNYELVLASNSPRRKELLASLHLPFSVFTLPDIDESFPQELERLKVAEYLSNKKADAHLGHVQENKLIITADTIVCNRTHVFGKPDGKTEAMEILQTLSGKTHQVVTGVTLLTVQKRVSFSACTDVTFAVLSDEEIEFYLDTFHPYDKAGAYGIQEWIGHIGVTSIHGSYFNVMGLPVQKLYATLKTF